jgi:hypothetical protein
MKGEAVQEKMRLAGLKLDSWIKIRMSIFHTCLDSSVSPTRNLTHRTEGSEFLKIAIHPDFFKRFETGATSFKMKRHRSKSSIRDGGRNTNDRGRSQSQHAGDFSRTVR